MKKQCSRLLALALTICLCLSMVPAASAALAAAPKPGPIDMSVRAVEQAGGNVRVTYTARMNILEELATMAVTFRDHEFMSDLRFTCVLEDALVEDLEELGEDDFIFESAEWEGNDIFVYENAYTTSDGLWIIYKLHPAVVDDWANIETKAADIMDALTERMTMTASGLISGKAARQLPINITTTGEVWLEGIGIERVYGQYSIVGAKGDCRWRIDEFNGGFFPGHGTSGGALHDCPRNVYCPAGHFVDLDLKLWYHDGIHFCAEHELMIGMTGKTFEPYTPITRAMIVTILYRMEGKPIMTGAEVYDDVEPALWYGPAVEWGTESGVVNGYGGGKFGPMDPVTREQMAAIFYRYAQYKGYGVSENADIRSYADADDVSNYAVPAMQWACGAKLIQGANGKLMPLDSTTRAQAAAIIQRFCLNVAQ